jgi:hypothetical protein
MDEKVSCRDARQEILHVKDTDEGQMSGILSRHLLECDACRSHLAAMERCERVLVAEQSRLNKLAARLESGKRRLLVKIADSQPERPHWHRSLIWAGATAALLLTFLGVLTFINMREEYVPRRSIAPRPIVTHSVAEAAAFETVRELAAVVRRFETPATALPYTPPETESPSFVPRLLQECVADSQDTMRAIVHAKTTLTRREET